MTSIFSNASPSPLPLNLCWATIRWWSLAAPLVSQQEVKEHKLGAEYWTKHSSWRGSQSQEPAVSIDDERECMVVGRQGNYGTMLAGNSELNDYRGRRNHPSTALHRAARCHRSACVLTPQELSAPSASTLPVTRCRCWGGPCPGLHHLWKPPYSTRPGCCPSACPPLPQH